MAKLRSVLPLALLGALLVPASAQAQGTPAPAGTSPAPAGGASGGAAAPSGGAAGASGGASVGAGAGDNGAAAAGGAAPGAAGAAGAEGEGGEEGEMSMTFHASKRADMQTFAEKSFEEISIGKAKPRYSLNLFGDLSFSAASRSEGDLKPTPAYAVGVFDMLFNAEIESHFLATSEVAFEYSPSSPLAELERLHIRWKPNKVFFLEAGRFHTDFGYWNVAYHHGKWLQLPIERPRTIDLHSGIVPAHWIGMQGGVSLPVGKGAIDFVATVGSAHDPIGTGAHQHGGTASLTPLSSMHAKLEAVNLPFQDLHFGVSGIYSRINGEPSVTRPALPDQGIDEYIGNVFVAYPSFPFVAIAEGYEVQHQIPKGDLSSGEAGAKWRSYGAFAMVGYTLGKFTPYLRGEMIRSKANTTLLDPFFVPAARAAAPSPATMDVTEGIVGVRMDVATWSAIKLEYRLTLGIGNRLIEDQSGQRITHYPGIHTGTVNWSFGI